MRPAMAVPGHCRMRPIRTRSLRLDLRKIFKKKKAGKREERKKTKHRQTNKQTNNNHDKRYKQRLTN